MKNIEKTFLFTLVLSLVSVVIAVNFQLITEGSLTNCSYLDPISIDVFALIAALFLFLEGSYRIYEHKNMSLKNQFTRAIRVAFGCSIISLHIIQFLHK
ncbi:MAG: hypothetical protein AABX48_01950 [Nanoarchaeota archaeon]